MGMTSRPTARRTRPDGARARRAARRGRGPRPGRRLRELLWLVGLRIQLGGGVIQSFRRRSVYSIRDSSFKKIRASVM
jgi:hypothetical protein